MEIKMKPTSVIKARLGIDKGGKVQKFLTHTCAIHMDKYVPFRTGTLAGTVVEGSNTTNNVKIDKIIYDQEYAIFVYRGTRKSKKFTMNGNEFRLYKNMKYTKTMHPLAGPYWDKRMVSAEIHDVEKEVQDFIDRGGGK